MTRFMAFSKSTIVIISRFSRKARMPDSLTMLLISAAENHLALSASLGISIVPSVLILER